MEKRKNEFFFESMEALSKHPLRNVDNHMLYDKLFVWVLCKRIPYENRIIEIRYDPFIQVIRMRIDNKISIGKSRATIGRIVVTRKPNTVAHSAVCNNLVVEKVTKSIRIWPGASTAVDKMRKLQKQKGI